MYRWLQTTAWKLLFSEYHRILQPGGYVEFAEADAIIIRGGPYSAKLNVWNERSLRAMGIPYRISRRYRPIMEEAGFIDVDVRIVSLPLGSWGGRIGLSGMRVTFFNFLRFKDRIIAHNPGLTALEYEEAVEMALDELNEHHAYRNVFVYSARRPL
jgi:hypothetical protein